MKIYLEFLSVWLIQSNFVLIFSSTTYIPPCIFWFCPFSVWHLFQCLIKAAIEELRDTNRGITFVCQFYSGNNINKVVKCLLGEGRNPVSFYPNHVEEEERINSITEEDMKNWMMEHKDRDLVTNMYMVRGWEVSTVVVIYHSHKFPREASHKTPLLT